MTATPAVAKNDRRAASRERRRRQLIDATMKCIARKGMSSTTLGDVAREAGLSQGIVNLHFTTKENLLKETLETLAGEYKAHFEKALARSGPGAAEKLLALMELEFRPMICEPARLAVWFAFWGEVKARPTYRRICDETDNYYDDVVRELCETLIDEGAYTGIDADTATEALTAMTTGLWLSCLVSPQAWDRAQALKTVRSYLQSVFPNHFNEE